MKISSCILIGITWNGSHLLISEKAFVLITVAFLLAMFLIGIAITFCIREYKHLKELHQWELDEQKRSLEFELAGQKSWNKTLTTRLLDYWRKENELANRLAKDNPFIIQLTETMIANITIHLKKKNPDYSMTKPMAETLLTVLVHKGRNQKKMMEYIGIPYKNRSTFTDRLSELYLIFGIPTEVNTTGKTEILFRKLRIIALEGGRDPLLEEYIEPSMS